MTIKKTRFIVILQILRIENVNEKKIRTSSRLKEGAPLHLYLHLSPWLRSQLIVRVIQLMRSTELITRTRANCRVILRDDSNVGNVLVMKAWLGLRSHMGLIQPHAFEFLILYKLDLF